MRTCSCIFAVALQLFTVVHVSLAQSVRLSASAAASWPDLYSVDAIYGGILQVPLGSRIVARVRFTQLADSGGHTWGHARAIITLKDRPWVQNSQSAWIESDCDNWGQWPVGGVFTTEYVNGYSTLIEYTFSVSAWCASVSGEAVINVCGAVPHGSPIDPPGPEGGNGFFTNEVTAGTCSNFAVITHGWNSSPAALNALLPGELAHGSCVVFFDWQGAANPGGQFVDASAMGAMIAEAAAGRYPANLYRAFANAVSQGDVLFQKLMLMIKSGEITPERIKLVGHSFGGVVNGVAASKLSDWLRVYQNGALGTKIGEMVVLDTPQMPLVPGTVFINTASAQKIINIYGGLPNGAVGGPLSGDNVVNAGMDLGSRGVWLPNQLGHNELMSCWPQVAEILRSLQPGNYHESWDVATGLSSFLDGHPTYEFGWPVVWMNIVTALPGGHLLQLQSTQGHNAQIIEEQDDVVLQLSAPPQQGTMSRGRVTPTILSETNAAQVYRTVDIPSRAHFMELQFRVNEIGDGDELLVSCGTRLLYRTSLYGTNGSFVSSGPVFVGDIAGTTDVLCVTLMATGVQNSTSVVIKDPIFYYAGVPPGQDSDSDGIWDGYEMMHCGNLTNMNATTDVDHDGVSDVAEALADTNPLDSSDNLRVTVLSVSDNAVDISWRSSPTRQYAIDVLNDLGQTWTSNGLSLRVMPDEGTSTTRTIYGDYSTQRFYRVSAMVPESP